MKKEREPGYVPTALELFTTIARRSLLGYLLLAAVSWTIAALTSDIEAERGVVLGVAIAGAAMGLTLLVMILTEKVAGINDMAALLGSYLIKMVILLVVFLALRDSDFFDKSAVLLGFAAAVVLSLVINTFTIARTRA